MARKRYALTPEQETAVRHRLDQLLAENRVYWQEHLAEYQAVWKEITQLQGSWNDPVLRERRRVLQRRSSELKLGEPIHPTTALPKIEQMLPKAQVEAYNQKHGRPSSMPAEGWGPMHPLSWPAEDREEMMRRMMFFREEFERTPPALRGPGLEYLRGVASDSLGPWERYVDAFIRVFDLDEAQQTTARSILRELQARRNEYQQTHRDEFQALRDAEDHKERSEISAELTPPIRAMFDELKARLDRIPRPAQRETAAQRDIEQHKRSARMAAAASRPSQPLSVESAEPTEARP
jgi:hypothetical protein